MTLLSPAMAAISDSPIARVWRNAGYARFMIGSAPYYVTIWMQRVAIGWLGWELSHSHAWVGAIAAADLGPMLILGPIAGAVADRSDPVKLLARSQAVMIAQACLVVALVAAGAMTVSLLLALSLMTGCANPFYTAARQIIVPRLVERSDLASAVSLDASFFHGSRFFGPALAAFTIPLFGISATCAMHILGCLAFSWMSRFLALEPTKQPARQRAGLMADIFEGVRYVRAHDALLPLFIMLTVASIVIRPIQELLPGFAGDVFHAGAGGLAWLTSSMGIGSLAAAIFLAMRGGVDGLVRLSIVATCGLAIATFGFVATRHLQHAVMFGVMVGFTLTLMGVSIQALVQQAVPDALRGRVMSLYALLFRGGPAIGAVAIGALAEHIGLRSTFAFATVLCLAAWVAVARREGAIGRALGG